MKTLFLYYNSEELRRFAGPWFLPGYLCGLGLKGEFSDMDRRKSMGLKVLYEGGEKIPVIPSEKEWNTWDLCAKSMRETYPLISEIPYREIDSDHTITCHLLHTWSSEGAVSLHTTTKKVNTVVKEWKNRVYRLYSKAETRFGTDQHIACEKKRTVLNLVNASDRSNLNPVTDGLMVYGGLPL